MRAWFSNDFYVYGFCLTLKFIGYFNLCELKKNLLWLFGFMVMKAIGI